MDNSSVYEQDTKLKSIQMNPQLTLAGYSRAASSTYFYVPQLKVQLDMGGYSKDYRATHFFISHSHLDHAMYLPDVAPAFVDQVSPNKIYVPAPMMDYAFNFIHSSQELNDITAVPPESMTFFDLMGVIQGDQFQIEKNNWVEVFDCVHSVASVGFGFFEKKK